MPKAESIRKTTRVGRYALGIEWTDGHESIMPYTNLRGHCPCEQCSATREKGEIPASSSLELPAIDIMGDASAFLTWADGHQTVYLLPELRALCRCAYCIGEPERPITGS